MRKNVLNSSTAGRGEKNHSSLSPSFSFYINQGFVPFEVAFYIDRTCVYFFFSVLYQYRLVPNLLEFSSTFLPLEDLELPLGKPECSFCVVNFIPNSLL